MERKFKDDYQRYFLYKKRLYQLGYRYLVVWFVLTSLYLYFEDRLVELFNGVVINNKLMSLDEIILYSFLVAWVISFFIFLSNGVDVIKERDGIKKAIANQSKKIKNYKSLFTEEGLKSKKVQRKLVKMENKMARLNTELDMLGF